MKKITRTQETTIDPEDRGPLRAGGRRSSGGAAFPLLFGGICFA